MPTAPARMPTADQMKAYAEQLPQIYRDVLTAFQDATPGRRFGEPVALATLDKHLINQNRRYDAEETTLAVGKLVANGFLASANRFDFFQPTPLGEELIAAVTGRRAKQITVPDLPKPTW